MLRSTGDKERDRRRIKTIYGTLISFHGRDRFSFQIFENGSGHLIDFPNDSTRVCPEALDRLKKLMGEESWRVEEITPPRVETILAPVETHEVESDQDDPTREAVITSLKSIYIPLAKEED